MEKEGESGLRIQVPLVSEEALISSFSLDRIAEELVQKQSGMRMFSVYGEPSFSFSSLLPRMGSFEALILQHDQFVERVHQIEQREMLQSGEKPNESSGERAMLQQALVWLSGTKEKA